AVCVTAGNDKAVHQCVAYIACRNHNVVGVFGISGNAERSAAAGYLVIAVKIAAEHRSVPGVTGIRKFPCLPAASSAGLETAVQFYIGNQYKSFVTVGDRKSTRLNSSHVKISYSDFCLEKKKDGRSACRAG